jgi:stage V sporulation protein B
VTKRSMIKGAAILAAAALINRFLGAVSRVALPTLIGDVGVGLYQMAYPVYGIFLVVSTAGIPVAVSKLVAEQVAKKNDKGAVQILRVATIILVVTGALFSIGLAFGAKSIAKYIARDPRAALAIIAVSPAIFVLSVASAFRGYYQGLQNMVPSALSQVVEQIIRVAAMIGLAWVFLPRGVEYAAAGANLGAVFGGAAGLFVLVIIYLRERRRGEDRKAMFSDGHGKNEVQGITECEVHLEDNYMASGSSLVRKIFELSFPVVLAAAIMPLMQFLDVGIVPLRLNHAGFSPDEITRLFGQLTGMAQPLMYFPTVVTAAVATSSVPAISEALASGDQSMLKTRGQEAIRLGFLFALPAAVGLFIFAKEFSLMLRWPQEVAVPLQALALGTVFLALQQISSGILQGLGAVKIPVKNLAIGGVAKLVVSFIFTGIPAFGIRGAALGTVAAFAVAGLMNITTLAKMQGFALDVRNTVVWPIIGVLLMVLGSRAVYSWVYVTGVGNTFSCLAAIIVAVAIYGITLLLSGVMGRGELSVFPGGSRLSWLLEKLGLLRR